ncbi:unnamed protein product [Bursaphelenchus xylophilus]|uniref:(pine wood nematode) hypothetical protein n=1 Tax=Bursaphelenchus xylophilus TaxID=6326 RepID=A0A1I7SEU8_BURXY|nr:unnamed protein product [Bursaphelenchus xylophilus]CAG9113211.1 unnamed protein product [Bursaphelenchus xylophilus]
MEVNGDLSSVLGNKLVKLDGIQLQQLRRPDVTQAIDTLGRLSADCFGARDVYTSSEKLLQNLDQSLYLSWEYDPSLDKSFIIGYIKVGKKHLFLYDKLLEAYEGDLSVVMDMFIHTTRQRRGHGKALFEFLLTTENLPAHLVALDNPTAALLSFFAKAFGLEKPVWQNTNIVVFQKLFDSIQRNDEYTPEGWRRPQAPRNLSGNGDVSLRYLDSAASGHPCKSRLSRDSSLSSSIDSADETMSQRQMQARNRKQQLLSSKPLW